ncbi:LysR family transcriptional regulator [Pectinatus haikarae]|uniref:DNA-binding transcriptional LysR family regulator n=1 Tax=Pectinatus haikarae TaxID=349096 RepID=A0ABT9Y463_9FIRM|nr:LysR family transcriptional regulator [Pectinatus haikarae]MDQ0202336.1 DNA-binding transcriptional LysR family regulator [Pectinatus haikarae]
MLIKQIKYFQAVVRCQNFTEAAEECYISQSAISQQIQALERELGVKLLERKKRKFFLTPAGEFFYKKSLVLVNDFDHLWAETIQIAKGAVHDLAIGYLKYYRGNELRQSIAEFRVKYPEVALQTLDGAHEELYEFLRTGKADIVISDLRRTPSNQYVNYYLTKKKFYAELAVQNSLAELAVVTMADLKNLPCIIVSSKEEEAHEESFYREYIGVKSDFVFADSLEEAHLMVVSGKGFMPLEFIQEPTDKELVVRHIPIIWNGKPVCREYYAFWRVDAVKNYMENFAVLLKKNFLAEACNKAF